MLAEKINVYKIALLIVLGVITFKALEHDVK